MLVKHMQDLYSEKYKKDIEEILKKEDKNNLDTKLEVFSFDCKSQDYSARLQPELFVYYNSKFSFVISSVDKRIANFYITQLPGCCGVGVIYNSVIFHPFREKGLQKYFDNYGVDLAKKLGFGLVLGTTSEDMEKQKKVLYRNKWEEIKKFYNPRSSNVVELYVKNLENHE